MKITPQSVDALGRITSVAEDGRQIIYHTDREEAQSFFAMSSALSAGRDTLWLILHAHKTPEGQDKRRIDARTTEQLKQDWIKQVTAAGLSYETAKEWLDERIELEEQNPI